MRFLGNMSVSGSDASQGPSRTSGRVSEIPPFFRPEECIRVRRTRSCQNMPSATRGFVLRGLFGFFGKHVGFGGRRVLGAFSHVWEGVRNSALFPPRGVHPGSEDAQLSKHALSHARIRFERTFRLFWETCRFRGPSRPRGLLARLGGCPFFRAFSAQRKLGKENAPNPETRSPRP